MKHQAYSLQKIKSENIKVLSAVILIGASMGFLLSEQSQKSSSI